jgi:Concanavalin A-like lectin/glucanases superfamily/Pectate lyase superfamily protein/Fibronectin type III domain/Abnormal spindle-like microcephaly-assoc'd, ASPM-SPD-2-Hydin
MVVQLCRSSQLILVTTLLVIVASMSGCGRTTSNPDDSSPSVDTSSSSVVFGSVTSGTSSAAQTVTLSNTSNNALNISSIALSGINASSFSESNNCSTSLAAGSSCTITTEFNPIVEGDYTAAITIADNASPSEQTITLNGTAPPISVSVNPATATLNSGQPAQLTATVANATNKAVTWSISPAGVGSISSSGLYTAPTTTTTVQTVTVTATSQADTAAYSSTTITLVSSVTVSVNPAATALNSDQPVQLTATVTNALNPSVTWSALFGTITPEGLYTAPSNTGSPLTDTITATSVQDPTKSATATVTVSSGLVGWWPLDEGTGLVAHDISGQGNNGTWSGTPSSPSGTYYTTGVVGPYAGYFDGSDDSVTVGTQPIYEFTGPFTLSAWVNTVASGTILSMQNGGDNGYNLGINFGVIRFCVYANTTQNCAGGGSYPLSSPAWTYFTAVFDGSNISVYANGAFLASSPAPAPTASTGPLAFGVAQRGGYSDFIGSLDDIRIYNRALSANEISSLYNTDVGAPNAPTNLVAYPGDSQMGLSWNTPTQGAIVTNYTVNYRQTGTSSWMAFPHNPSIVNAQVVTGLSNGTSYDFEVIPVSALGNGAASSTVSAMPMSNGSPGGGSSAGGSSGGDSSVVASDDDEFIGPFSSWLNVKTDFGAVGDGVADDTLAFQYALNALESPSSHASVLYIPAGTYKITSGLDYVSTNCATYCTGKSIIGESPTNTILEWEGNATGTAMVTLDGIDRMQFDRLTLDGEGAQITLINETMHLGCCYDGSNEYTDNVFENAAIGIQAGDNTVGCCSAETKVDRDTFVNLDMAGISLENFNALDWYVRYSTFEHDNYGVTNAYGAGGAMHLDHNLFEYNNIDSGWGNGTDQSYTYNTSYHSGTFLSGSPYGNSSIFIGNTILMPQTAAIYEPGIGPLTLIDNTIEGTITAAQGGQTVILANGAKATPNSYVLSMDNTYTSATPFSVQNVTYGPNEMSSDLTSINDTVASISNINVPLPMMPGPLPNYNRTIYDVPQGASGSTIQATIDQAVAQNNGNRPVVHIPWGQYSISSTITIPGNSDVQIVGDSMQTIINWNGSTSSPVFALLAPSHATIRNLTINAGSASAGILVEGSDQPGDRIYTNFAAEGAPGSSHNLLVNGFDNTLVQMDDFAHGGLTNPSSTSVLVVGGPLTQAGKATPGYTGLFMGSSCCNTGPSYTVENGGTIVLTGFWYEQGGTGWLYLNGGSGNFIGYEDNIAVDSWASLTSALPSFAANNFTGNLTITNSTIQNSYVSLAGSTPANVLLLADTFNSLVTPPVIANTNTNPNTQAATIFPTWVSGSTGYTVPDEVSPGTSRNTLIGNSLTQLAGYKDPPIKDLPSANEDVRLVDVIVNNGTNSFDFESGASSSSPTNQVHPAGNNASSGMVVPSSRPTPPWCKRINNKDGAAAGTAEMGIHCD